MNIIKEAVEPTLVKLNIIAESPESAFVSIEDEAANLIITNEMAYPAKATRPQAHLSQRQKLISALNELRGLEDRYGDVSELSEVFGAAEKACWVNEV